MKVEKCYCDRCGKELNENNAYDWFRITTANSKYPQQYRHLVNGDICDNCQISLQQWWQQKDRE